MRSCCKQSHLYTNYSTPREAFQFHSATMCCSSLIVFIYPCQVAERGCALDINSRRKRFKPDLSYSPPSTEISVEQKRKDSYDRLNEPSEDTIDKDKGTLYEINLNHSR